MYVAMRSKEDEEENDVFNATEGTRRATDLVK